MVKSEVAAYIHRYNIIDLSKILVQVSFAISKAVGYI